MSQSAFYIRDTRQVKRWWRETWAVCIKISAWKTIIRITKGNFYSVAGWKGVIQIFSPEHLFLKTGDLVITRFRFSQSNTLTPSAVSAWRQHWLLACYVSRARLPTTFPPHPFTTTTTITPSQPPHWKAPPVTKQHPSVCLMYRSVSVKILFAWSKWKWFYFLKSAFSCWIQSNSLTVKTWTWLNPVEILPIRVRSVCRLWISGFSVANIHSINSSFTQNFPWTTLFFF